MRLLTVLFLLGQFAQAQDVLAPPDKPRPEYKFNEADTALLDEIQRHAFEYFRHEVGNPSGLVKDRTLGPVCSIAAVGFQLAALPIAVERGWIERADAEARARRIMKSLYERDDNKWRGLYLHFLDLDTGGPNTRGWSVEASTIDTAILFAGAMTASSYFGGEVAELCDKMLAAANWRTFVQDEEGFMRMSWRADKGEPLTGKGQYSRHRWHVASDEERLVYFIACGSPTPEHAIEPAVYYRLKRVLKPYGDVPPFVVSPQGTLFHYFFAHCFIDQRSMGPDNPSAFGVEAPRVDWFENSVRATRAHRLRCIEKSKEYTTLAPDRWGLSACDSDTGYAVPEILPNLSDIERWFDGLIAPYAAGTSIMFLPEESVAALRAFRELKSPDGKLVAWRTEGKGAYGLVDSFNLQRNFTSQDTLGIDHGPLILGIENARTGLVWKLFMQHPAAKRAVERLKLEPLSGS